MNPLTKILKSICMGLLTLVSRRKPKVCQECWGTGKIVLTMEDGQGGADCHHCKGKGKIPYNRY